MVKFGIYFGTTKQLIEKQGIFSPFKRFYKKNNQRIKKKEKNATEESFTTISLSEKYEQ